MTVRTSMLPGLTPSGREYVGVCDVVDAEEDACEEGFEVISQTEA
jgi:hypothetical protein